MEDFYHLNQDCITELSYIIVDNDPMLSKFTAISKFTRSLFFSRRTLISCNKYIIDHFAKFKNVQSIHIPENFKCINLNALRNLKSLTVFNACLNSKIIFDNYSQLTYLTLDVSRNILDVKKCMNLIYLHCYYFRGIEYLIHLRTLECFFEYDSPRVADFSLLSRLTKIKLKSNGYQTISSTHRQKVTISEDCSLINFIAHYIDFSSNPINSQKIKTLCLKKCFNISFSNLVNIQNIKFDILHGFNIFDQTKSYQHLTYLFLRIDSFPLRFENMINLKEIEFHTEYNTSNALSILTSLCDVKMTHEHDHTLDMSCLNNVTSLRFKNIGFRGKLNSVILPANLQCLYIQDNCQTASNWPAHILNQINDMKYLTCLKIKEIIFSNDKNEILSLENQSLQSLHLRNAEVICSNKMVKLNCLKLKNINIHSKSYCDLINLTKLILEGYYYTKSTTSNFINLKVLQLNYPGNSVDMLAFRNITNLISNLPGNYAGISNFAKLNKLKTVTFRDFEVFSKFCKRGFPESVENICIIQDTNPVRKLRNKIITKVRNINLQFKECK